MLRTQVQKEGYFKDAVDFQLIMCDVRCNCGQLDLTSLGKLGEDLEAAKRFHDAGEVYLDMAEGRFGRDGRVTEELTRGFAALAFKRDMD